MAPKKWMGSDLERLNGLFKPVRDTLKPAPQKRSVKKKVGSRSVLLPTFENNAE